MPTCPTAHRRGRGTGKDSPSPPHRGAKRFHAEAGIQQREEVSPRVARCKAASSEALLPTVPITTPLGLGFLPVAWADTTPTLASLPFLERPGALPPQGLCTRCPIHLARPFLISRGSLFQAWAQSPLTGTFPGELIEIVTPSRPGSLLTPRHPRPCFTPSSRKAGFTIIFGS